MSVISYNIAYLCEQCLHMHFLLTRYQRLSFWFSICFTAHANVNLKSRSHFCTQRTLPKWMSCMVLTGIEYRMHRILFSVGIKNTKFKISDILGGNKNFANHETNADSKYLLEIVSQMSDQLKEFVFWLRKEKNILLCGVKELTL